MVRHQGGILQGCTTRLPFRYGGIVTHSSLFVKKRSFFVAGVYEGIGGEFFEAGYGLIEICGRRVAVIG